jgi:hypothetical protein
MLKCAKKIPLKSQLELKLKVEKCPELPNLIVSSICTIFNFELIFDCDNEGGWTLSLFKPSLGRLFRIIASF